MSGGWSRYTRGGGQMGGGQMGCDTLLVMFIVLLVGMLALGQCLGPLDSATQETSNNG